ncbi:MAG: LysR substrate-binding domain-containing protein [Bacteroidota bacterium]
MELRHLKYFLVVAEELHFRRAAERLFIAQPGLSRQIRQLEEDLGVALFKRHNRKVELTPAGAFLREKAEVLLGELEHIVTATRQVGEGLRGQLRIGYIGSAMQHTVPDLLLKVSTLYPDIHFSLKEMDNQQQLEALLSREIDLGFVRLERVSPPLKMRAVFEDTFSLVLPEDHPLTPATFTGLRQLREEPFILFEASYSSSYYETVMQLFDAEGFTPTVSHNTVNASSIYRLVANGLGLAIVPTVLLEGYDMRIKSIELTKVPQRTTLRAVWHDGEKGGLLAQVLGMIFKQ